MNADFRVPPALAPKANLWALALRRRIFDYWYATLEGEDAAHAEAALAAIVVNVLDEAVFQAVHGEAYRTERRLNPLGRVVMGLELIRNCEVHSSEAGSLKEHAMFSFPGVGMRAQYHWPALADLPAEYRKRQTDEHRARGEARDAYDKWVADRPVIETLLDAVAFFGQLDSSLVADQPIELTSPLCSAPLAEDGQTALYKPVGLDRYALFLPDLACRNTERRAPHWPSADRWLADENQRIRKTAPKSIDREVVRVIRDSTGRTIAYTGLSGLPRDAYRTAWTERASQVGRDVRFGCRHYVIHHGAEIELTADEQLRVKAIVGTADVLSELDDGESEHDLRHLELMEHNPDLYRRSRLVD